jgi:hypothetical protein
MNDFVAIAVTDTTGSRVAVCCVAVVAGAFMIAVGRHNIRTQAATAKRTIVNSIRGTSNSYEGREAVRLGWLRIVMGCGAIIFGIVFLFVGPFLAKT